MKPNFFFLRSRRPLFLSLLLSLSFLFILHLSKNKTQEILGFFQRPENFVDYHRESNGNDHVRVGRWKPSPANVAAVESAAAALAEAGAEAKGSNKKSVSPPPSTAAAAPAAPVAAPESFSHPACAPLSRHVAFLVSFRAPAWFKKAVGTETVKVRDSHDLVARVDRSTSASTIETTTSTSAEVPKLETIIMRSQPRLWLPTAGTELKIAEITFDVAVKPEDDEEETDEEGEFSRGVRLADGGAPVSKETSSSSQQQARKKKKPVANNKGKPTLVMRATVIACFFPALILFPLLP